MIKEELEQKAEDYANKWLWFVKDLEMERKTDPKPEYIRIEEAYVAGATENGIQWHDLRKDPNDLPKDSHTVQDEDGERFYYFRGQFYYESDRFYNQKPIAWCEIPQFKE